MTEYKKAYVYQDRNGYWKVEDDKTGNQIGGYQDSDLEAHQLANSNGYLVD